MKNFSLPKLYPITDARISGLSHEAQIERLAVGGARFVQLREKHLAPGEFFQEAKKSLKIAREKSVKVIINDRVDIALVLKADGVHLGQDDLPPADARKILGANAIIGFSTHNLEQAIAATKLPIDYIAIGPIFETFSKEKPDAVVGLEGLRNVRAQIGAFPLVAIGGITRENARSVLEAGADSVAIISFLLKEPGKIVEKTQEITNTMRNS